MSTKEALEKTAAEADGKFCPGYDLKWGECEYLFKLAQSGSPFQAIAIAFRVGLVRGHRATVRGRIKTKKQSKRG